MCFVINLCPQMQYEFFCHKSICRQHDIKDLWENFFVLLAKVAPNHQPIKLFPKTNKFIGEL